MSPDPQPESVPETLPVPEAASSSEAGSSSGNPHPQLLNGPRIQDGPALLHQTARRLACDARIVVAVDGPTGETLDLGRAYRFPNAALTRTLWHRDGSCQYPGCHRTRNLVAHHVKHWADGGPTDPFNCCLLCTTHHRALHEGQYQLTRTPTGDLLFTSHRGTTIIPAPTQAGRPTGATTSHKATITADTTTPDWSGDRLDVSLAVEATRTNWDLREQNAHERPDNQDCDNRNPDGERAHDGHTDPVEHSTDPVGNPPEAGNLPPAWQSLQTQSWVY